MPSNCRECTSENNCTKCKDGWSGVPACQCSHNCFRVGDLDSWCFANGTCAKGCIGGKFGAKCDIDCPQKERCVECAQYSGRCKKCANGLYGEFNHCDKTCGNCMPDASDEVKCSIEDGECFGACIDGYYGYNCKQSCSKNCFDPITKTNRCNKSTGECLACKTGFYGTHCLNSCSLNCEVSSELNGCDKDTGRCKRCLQKYYGDFCEKKCSMHCEPSCDKTTGACDTYKEGVSFEKRKQLCNSATVKILAGVLAAVTAALLATVVGLVCLYRRGKAARRSQNPAIYYNTSPAEVRSGTIESASPLHAPHEDQAYADLKANVMAEANYSQLQHEHDAHLYTQSA